MAKSYIYQLNGGKMLVFEDGMFSVEETGYPLPDCRLSVGSRLLGKKDDILRAILGYDIEDSAAFIEAVSDFETMSYDDFKFKVQLENIGGGCPARLQRIARYVKDDSLSTTQAVFRSILPPQCVDDSVTLPSTEDIMTEYGDVLRHEWRSKLHRPDWRFKNNAIIFTGVGEITDTTVDFVKDLIAICMKASERPKFRYISTISLTNGNGAVVLTDSYINNCDIDLLYQRVTGADLSVGRIVSEVDADGNATAHFECLNPKLKAAKLPTLHGVVIRHTID